MPDHRHSREDALDRVQFLDLYRAALQIDDQYRRLAAVVMILCTGRLKMRISEVMHLHEGWINWRKGYIRIPAFEPCGCGYCWERSQENFDSDDDDDGGDDIEADTVEEFHYQRRYSPKSEMGARIVPFNWSRRVTAALEAFFSEHTVIDENYKWTERTMKDHVLPNARFLDDGDIMWHGLRSTAVTFWADNDIGAKALRDAGGWIRHSDSNPYRAQSPTQLGNKMRAAVGKDPLDFGTTDFVALDPRPFAGEPFDPRETSPTSRADPFERGPVMNPRTANPPNDVDYDPSRYASLAAERDPPTPSERRAFVRRVEGERHGDRGDTVDPYLEAAQQKDEPAPGQSRFSEFLGDEEGVIGPAGTAKVAYVACVIAASWSITLAPLLG